MIQGIHPRTLFAERLRTTLTLADTQGEGRTDIITPNIGRRQADKPTELICRFDLSGTIVFVNSEFASFYQCETDGLLGQRADDLEPGTLQRELIEALARTAGLSIDNPVDTREVRVTDSHGRRRWIRWTERVLFDQDQGSGLEPAGFEQTGKDITLERMAEEDAAYQAAFDPLTGVLNRQSFWHNTERALKRAAAGYSPVGVLIADISRVVDVATREAVLDVGLAAGDRIREEVAERILATFRSTDSVGRIDQDRFAVLCPDLLGPDVANALVQRLEYVVGGPMVGLEHLQVRANCGWVVSNGEHEVSAILTELEAQVSSEVPAP